MAQAQSPILACPAAGGGGLEKNGGGGRDPRDVRNGGGAAAGGGRHAAASTAAALLRVLLGASEAVEEKEEAEKEVLKEVVVREGAARPALEAGVRAGRAGQDARLSGRRRAARNVAWHNGLGAGADATRRMLADPQKAQRGGRGACAGQTKAAGGSEEEPGPEASGGSEGSEKYDGGGFTTPPRRSAASGPWAALPPVPAMPLQRLVEGGTEDSCVEALNKELVAVRASVEGVESIIEGIEGMVGGMVSVKVGEEVRKAGASVEDSIDGRLCERIDRKLEEAFGVREEFKRVEAELKRCVQAGLAMEEEFKQCQRDDALLREDVERLRGSAVSWHAAKDGEARLEKALEMGMDMARLGKALEVGLDEQKDRMEEVESLVQDMAEAFDGLKERVLRMEKR